jgi:hypothetical protein
MPARQRQAALVFLAPHCATDLGRGDHSISLSIQLSFNFITNPSA